MAGNFRGGPRSRVPSTTSTEETTSSYPTDRVTRKHHDPKGNEGLHDGSYDRANREKDVSIWGDMGKSG